MALVKRLYQQVTELLVVSLIRSSLPFLDLVLRQSSIQHVEVKPVVVVQVSRMEPGKGHDLLLSAAATLPKHLNWFIWFVGGAQRDVERRYVEHLKSVAAKLGVSKSAVEKHIASAITILALERQRE